MSFLCGAGVLLDRADLTESKKNVSLAHLFCLQDRAADLRTLSDAISV